MKKTIALAALLCAALTSCSTDGTGTGLTGSDVALGGDTYTQQEENPFINVADAPVSTFSIDADGASYANSRRFISQESTIPPKGAIRTEEFINYFDLNYDNSSANPVAVNGEVSLCPWNTAHKLVRIGLKGKDIPQQQLPASNFVFLIDVSGSMGSDDKLKILKEGFSLFVDQMKAEDRVAIVTYAGSSGLVLASTPGSQKQVIKNAINSLGSGGSTAGAEGIVTAYDIAQQNVIDGGNNRIILGTDGDFNVGISSQEELVSLIEEKRSLGIFLTVLGVGRGNLNDAALEQIANNGNGNYEYIDSVAQLKKIFIYEYSKFFTVAKDVKVQVTFNPENIESYRLIGYENRILSQEDFDDDTADAGEIGANQNITALYEVVPRANINFRQVPTFTIDFRYKLPNSSVSSPMQLDIFDEGNSFEQSSGFMKLTAAASSFAMILADSQYKGDANYATVQSWILLANQPDQYGLINEFKTLVQTANGL